MGGQRENLGLFGPAYEQRLDSTRLRTQLEVIREVMLSAGGRHTRASGLADSAWPDSGWYTLRELAQLTCYGEASISAQLRHLRKPQFGGYVVEKRRRRGEGPRAGVWEYRVLARAG